MDDSVCYVVLMGRKPGVYKTWDEVIEVTKDFKGASYKKCTTAKEAYQLLKSVKRAELEQTSKLSSLNIANIYVDGSFDSKKMKYSYAFALVSKNEVIYKENGLGENKEAAVSLKSQAGELKAAMKALLYAAKNGYKHIIIYHDNESIQYLITEKIEARNDYTKSYVSFVKKVINNYGLSVDFTKVKAHNGNEFNELVDELAKDVLFKNRKKKTNSNRKERNLSKGKVIFYLKECGKELKKDPKIVSKSVIKKLKTYYGKVKSGLELTGRECFYLEKYYRKIKRNLQEKEEEMLLMDNDKIKNTLLEIESDIFKKKEELKWFASFLPDMVEKAKKNEPFTPRQIIYIEKGIDRLKKIL